MKNESDIKEREDLLFHTPSPFDPRIQWFGARVPRPIRVSILLVGFALMALPMLALNLILGAYGLAMAFKDTNESIDLAGELYGVDGTPSGHETERDREEPK